MSDEEKYVPIYLEGEAGTLKLKMPKILEESISEKGFSDFNDKRYDDLLNRVEDERKDVQNRVLMLVSQANKKAKEAQKQQLDVLKNASKNLATIQEARTAFKTANNKLKEEIEKIEENLKNNKINKDLTKEQKRKLQSELKDLRALWKKNISQMDYLKKFTQSYKATGVQIGAISIKHIDGIIKHIVFEFEKLKVKLAELRATGNNKVLNLAKRNKYVSQINFMIGNKSELQKRIAEINTFTISKGETTTSIQNKAINDLLNKTSAKLKYIFVDADKTEMDLYESAENVSKEMSKFEKNLGSIQGFDSMSDNDKRTITNSCRIYLAATLINEPQFRKRLVELKTYIHHGLVELIAGLLLVGMCFIPLAPWFSAAGIIGGVAAVAICLTSFAGSVLLSTFGASGLAKNSRERILDKSLLAPKEKHVKRTEDDLKKVEDKLKKEMKEAASYAKELKSTTKNEKHAKDIADLTMQLEQLNKTAKEQATSYEKQIKIKDDEIKKLIYEIKVLKGKVD